MTVPGRLKVYSGPVSGWLYTGYGESGYSGYSGSGVSGFSGYSGYSGSGVSGYSGYSGDSGLSGYSGYSGDSGYSGYSGSGVSGYSGYSGDSGYSGYSGYSSFSGYSGYSSFSGISGYSGYSGESGYSGYSGSGISGYSGWSGFGLSGYSGYSGQADSGYSGYSGMAASGGGMYVNFTYGDLVGGVLTIVHNLGQIANSVTVIDNNNKIVIPDEVTFTDPNTVAITLTSYGLILGTWSAVITNGGGVAGVSGFSGFSGYSGTSGATGGGMTMSFTDATLSSGVLSVNHNLHVLYNDVAVYDNNNRLVLPDLVTLVDVDNLTVSLSSYQPLVGTWNVIVTNGGGGNYAGTSGYSGYSAVSGYSGYSGARGGGTTGTFTYADLVAGVYTFAHGLNQQYNSVTIIDNNNKVVVPDEVTFISTSQLTVNLASYGLILGNWTIVVTNGGGEATSGYSGPSGFSGYSGIQGPQGGGMTQAFTNANLSAGVLSVNHNLHYKYNEVAVYDNNDRKILPDLVTMVDDDNLTIDLTSYTPLTGTWNIIVTNGGGGNYAGTSGYSGFSISGYSGYSGPQGPAGGGTFKSFVYTDLVAGIYACNHGLGVQYNSVTIIDNNGKIVIPDEVIFTTVNQCTINLASFGVFSGTWYAVVTNGGGQATSGYSGYSGESGYSGFSGMSGIRGGGTVINFTNADLVTGVVTLTHNQAYQYNAVTIFDNNNLMVIPDAVTLTGLNTATVSLVSYAPITGTWTAVVSNGGGSSGYSGVSGYSGYSGYSGISGYSGYSGYSGESGYSGYSGYSGESGYSGYSGESGYSGYSGMSGYSGYSGYSGFSGDNPGSSGYSGYSGFSGDNPGSSGYSGYSGYSGVDGVVGADGASGYSGYSGASGTGPSGYSGYSGTPGAAGQGLRYTFTNADLVAGVLTATHSFGTQWNQISVYDNTNTMIFADSLVLTDANTITVDLSSYGTITGTWSLFISNGAGYSGYSGLGLSGYSGPSGYSGFSGDNPGSSGYSGYSGWSGVGIGYPQIFLLMGA